MSTPLDPEIKVTVNAGDLTLVEALSVVEDASWYWETLPLILHHYSQFDTRTYWDLTVTEHHLMVTYLEKLNG